MKHLLIVGLVVLLTIQIVNLTSRFSSGSIQVRHMDALRSSAIKAGIGDPGKEITAAVRLASKQTGLSEPLLVSLIHSESSFNPKAVSSKQYQGLMQIPQKVHYPDANCLIGARIFLEKLKITDGDYRKAIIIYKGWDVNHPEGKRQADKVIALARKLKEAQT